MQRFRKPALIALAILCLGGAGAVQQSLNYDRDVLGLTRSQPLENAPPVLAFTTVALGGFRGLISNLLWIRANQLQEDGKYFEMAQIASWITKLEPGFAQVWAVLAWNMAYNISVKFKDNPPGEYGDRWRWVQRGIELLRDEGLRYNPNNALMYSELSWLFYHKMGDNLDDGNMYYKQRWAAEMTAVLGATNHPNFEVLIHPQTDEDRARAEILRTRYKMDPELMRHVHETYGPLEWRLPEAHAIYWAAAGLRQAEREPERFDRSDLDRIRRSIYQGMMRSFQRGRLISYGEDQLFQFGPNLDIIPRVSAIYEQLMDEPDVGIRDGIATAHRNFLGDAIYFLFTHNRIAEARKWWDYLAEKYPDRNLLTDPESFPRNLTLEEYCFARVEEEISETGQLRVNAIIRGLIASSYTSLIFDNDDRAAGLMALARAARERYEEDTDGTGERIRLPPFEEMQSQVLQEFLDPESGVIPEARARLRFKLRLPPEEAPARNAPSAQHRAGDGVRSGRWQVAGGMWLVASGRLTAPTSTGSQPATCNPQPGEASHDWKTFGSRVTLG